MTYRAPTAFPTVAHPLTRLAVTAVLLCCLSVGSARAGDVGGLHAAWQGCLHRTFGVQAALTSRTLAADIALRACRSSEEAYLAALSISPLVDSDDVVSVRPALLQRARGWLLRGTTSRLL